MKLKTIWLILLGFVVIVIPVLCQTPAEKGPSFEVATIKPSDPGQRGQSIINQPGGRLVIPLTLHIPGMPHGVGAMIRVERRDPRWPAKVVSPVGIYDCVNARDPANEAELRKLMALGPSGQLAGGVTAVVEPHERGDGCLLHLSGFCLQK